MANTSRKAKDVILSVAHFFCNILSAAAWLRLWDRLCKLYSKTKNNHYLMIVLTRRIEITNDRLPLSTTEKYDWRWTDDFAAKQTNKHQWFIDYENRNPASKHTINHVFMITITPRVYSPTAWSWSTSIDHSTPHCRPNTNNNHPTHQPKSSQSYQSSIKGPNS